MVWKRDMKRASQVLRVLARNGLGYLVEQMGLRWHLPLVRSREKTAPEDVPEALRKSFDELGGTFVKLGQMLSLRPDLVPKKYCDEFKLLLDEVRPLPFSKIQAVITAELGQPISKVFKSIEKKPLGSASIAQVHRAVLKTGRQVVVKVQRPEVRQQFGADIDILYYLASKAEPHLPREISPLRVIEEFERFSKSEMNFRHEAKNIDLCYQNASKPVRIPRVYWEHCTSKVLIIEFLKGKKLRDAKAPKKVARQLIDALTQQVFVSGVFHADLHPGNIILMPRGQLGLIDFGIVGRLSPELKVAGFRLWLAMAKGDTDGVVRVLTDVGFAKKVDLDDFRGEVYAILRDWQNPSSEQARMTSCMHRLFNSSKVHGISLPIDVVLLGKAFLTAEGTCLDIDPDFDFLAYSKKKCDELLKKEVKPAAVFDKALSSTRNITEVMYRLPTQVSEALDRIKYGKVELSMQDTDIKHLAMDINRSSNRVSFAAIISAFAVAGALTVSVGPRIYNMSILSVLLFMLSALWAVPLLVSIFREGRAGHDNHKEV
jgi:ubiquinone biosynthesis protein